MKVNEVVFYLDGKEIGRSEINEASTMYDRHEVAKKLKLVDFDDFSFVQENSMERLKASEIIGTWIKNGKAFEGTLAEHERQSYLLDKSIGRDFGTALTALKNGYKLAREGWNGKGMYITLKPGYPNGIACNKATAEAHSIPEGTVITYCPYLEMKTADNKLVPWLASQTDILAEDWTVVGGN